MTEYLPLIIALIGAGGLAATITAVYKAKPEAGKVIVDSATEVVVMQSNTLKLMQDSIDKLSKRVDDLEASEKTLRDALDAARAELARVRGERDTLRAQVVRMQAQIEQLQREPRRQADPPEADYRSPPGAGDDDVAGG